MQEASVQSCPIVIWALRGCELIDEHRPGKLESRLSRLLRAARAPGPPLRSSSGIVVEVRAEPAFDLLDAHALSLVVIVDLISVDLPE